MDLRYVGHERIDRIRYRSIIIIYYGHNSENFWSYSRNVYDKHRIDLLASFRKNQKI